MRVFIALMPDTASIAALQGLMDHREGWHHSEDLHMTLHFLGDRSNVQIEYLIHELDTCDFIDAVKWQANYLGDFPDSLNANFWVVEGLLNKNLELLLDKLESSILIKAGRTYNEFRPHVSLCHKKRMQKLERAFEEGAEFEPLKLRFNRIVLVESKYGEVETGPRYHVLWQRNLS
jgi:2'-5' RNA ligase